MNLLYPEQNLPPFDRKVTGTIEATRAKYQEGLMTYSGRLHHYLTMKNTENFIVRGEQQKTLEELYSILVHTSATHAGFEWGVKPWGDRDFGNNLTPHGWFGAKYISVIRNMLLREEQNDLHLLSVLSPAWTSAGQWIVVRQAPTYFGALAMEARFREDGMTLDLKPEYKVPPERIVVHLPWYVKASAATVDGKQVAAVKGRLTLPASARKVDVSWTAAGGTAGFSYLEAVGRYRREYRLRYEKFLQEGPPDQPGVRY